MTKILKVILCCIFVTNMVRAQDFEVASNGSVLLAKNSYLVVNNITVISGGTVTLHSDTNKSASILVDGTATGNITYNRYLDSTDWYLVSAPITNQSVNDFITANTPALNTNGTKSALGVYISENPATTKWSYFNSADIPTELQGNLVSGKGYSVNRNTIGSLAFTGNITTNDVTIPLITTSGTHFWHSVGNPFPSYLSGNSSDGVLNILGQNLTKLNPLFSFLYVFDGTNYEPIAIDGPAFQISPGQAFMVNPKSDNETFTFSKSITKYQSGAATFYKTANTESRLKITMNDGSTEKTTIIRYLENATQGLDVGYDAGAYQTGTPKYAINTWLVNNSYEVDFTIQALPNKDYDSNVIPLSIYADAGKTLTLSVKKENLPKDINVFIEDKYLATTKEITSNSYQIKVDKSLSGVGRFYLHTTTKSVLSTEDLGLTSISIFVNQERELVINGLSLGSKVQSNLYSLLGKQVHHNNFISKGIQHIQLPKNIAKGIYIAKVIVDGKSISKKIIMN